MKIIDSLLAKYKVNYEELRPDEKETLFQMVEDVKKTELTPEKMLAHITAMRYIVEESLINEPEFNYIFIFKVPNRKQILLKARLQNYILLEAFLSRPKKARELLESSLANAENKP